MQTTGCVYKNSFRKIKLWGRDSRLAEKAPCITHKHSFGWSSSLFSPTSASCGEGKNTAQARKVRRGCSLKQPAFLFLVNMLHCKCISSTKIHLQYSFILNKIRCDLLQLSFLIHIITVWIYLYCTCKSIFINIFFKRWTALCHIILGVLMKRNNMLTWTTI